MAYTTRQEIDTVIANIAADPKLTPEQKADYTQRMENKYESELPPVVIKSDKAEQVLRDAVSAYENEGVALPEGFSVRSIQNGLEAYDNRKKAEEVAKMVDAEPIPERYGSGIANSPFGMLAIGQAYASGAMPREKYEEYTTAARYGSKEAPTDTSIYKNARAAGIDTYTGLTIPYNTREGLASLAASGRSLAQYGLVDYSMRKQMKEAGVNYPDNLPIIMEDPTGITGEPVYMRFDPETKKLRYTLLNPEGITGREAIGFGAVELPRAVMEAGGAAAGYAMGMNSVASVPLGTLGSGLGGWAATEVQRELVRSLAPPEIADEVADGITSTDQFFDTMFAMGGEALAGTAMGAFRIWQNNFTSHVLNLSDAETKSASAQVQELLETVAEMKKAGLTSADFNFGAGAATGDPVLMVMEGLAQSNARDATAQELTANALRNDLNARKVLQEMSDVAGVKPLPERKPKRIGSDLQDTVREKYGLKKTDTEIDATKKNLLEARGTPESTRPGEVEWSRVRTATEEEIEAARQAEVVAWNGDPERGVEGFYDVIGVTKEPGGGYSSQIRIDNGANARANGENSVTPLVRTVKDMSADSKRMLSQQVQDTTAQMLNDLGATDRAIQLRATGRLGEADAEEVLAGTILEPTLDPRMVHRLLSDLKAKQTAYANDPKQLGWNKRDLSNIITDLENMMKGGRYVNAGDSSYNLLPKETADMVTLAWENANKATTYRASIEKGDVIRKMLQTYKKPDGTEGFRMDAVALDKLLFKSGDSGTLAMVMEMVGKNPEVTTALARELEKKYARTVMPNDKFLRGQHNKFMDNYQGHMKLLFGENGSSQINNLAQFGKKVDLLEGKKRASQAAIRRAYGVAKLGSDDLYAGNIAKRLFSTGENAMSINQIGNLKADLRRVAPDLWDDIQSQASEQVQQILTKRGNSMVNSASINKMIAENAGTLEAVFGKQYVNNLRNLGKIAQTIDAAKAAKAATATESPQPLTVLVFRTIYGPLDKKQRVITAGVKLFKNQKNKATLEILKDPQKMYKFKQLDRLSATNFAGIALLTENMLGDKAKDLYTQDDVDYWNSKGDPETAQWISNYMEASAKIRGIREGVYKPPPEGQKPPPYRPVGGGTAMDRERASRGVR